MRQLGFLIVGLATAATPTLAAPSFAGRCAQSDNIRISPAEMLQAADDFRAALGPADRSRLDTALPRAADGRIAICESRDGTSCDDNAYMAAFRRTGLMPRFLATLCPNQPGQPGSTPSKPG